MKGWLEVDRAITDQELRELRYRWNVGPRWLWSKFEHRLRLVHVVYPFHRPVWVELELHVCPVDLTPLVGLARVHTGGDCDGWWLGVGLLALRLGVGTL